MAEFRKNESIYTPEKEAGSVMDVQKSGVHLSVLNGSDKKTAVTMFGPTDFFGEACIASQIVRMGTATAIRPATVLIIEDKKLLCVLQMEQGLSNHFIRCILAHKSSNLTPATTC
ncbi:MAG: cyclic nucleotide-binding domain-containing protein [Candidatus Acidiferrum sp.]